MDRHTLNFINKTVQELVVSTIVKPSARDRQRVLGPSDLSDPCDLCLGRNFLSSVQDTSFMSEETQDHFSFAAWVGTAIHEKLENEFLLPADEALLESSVEIASIPGYNVIKGHVDLYLPRLGVWVDYKTTTKDKLKRIRLNGVPERHTRQQMMYGYGLRNTGNVADASVIVYIPRDSNDVRDIWCATAPYSEEWAVDSLERAERIWNEVSSAGRSELPSYDDCYMCTRYGH